MNQTRHYSGLNDAEVLESRRLHGTNVLTPPQKETLWDRLRSTANHWIMRVMAVLVVLSLVAAAILSWQGGAAPWMMPAMLLVSSLLILLVGFFGAFHDPLFRILITAFVLSMGISIYEYEWRDAGPSVFFEPVGIIVALLLATGVSFFLERRNEKTFQSLNEVDDDTPVKVVRNDNVCQVPRRDIVVGDIVILEAGEEVPADCELLEALQLNVDESSLTGEPHAHKTTVEAHFDLEATYPSNHILKGTMLLEGYCTARVLRVGDATESGKVFEAAQVKEGNPTPLNRKLDALALIVTRISYLVALLIVIGRMFMYATSSDTPGLGDTDGWLSLLSYFLQTIMVAVTLIVVAVPEGLPMSVTLSLAFSMRQLMREQTLPRTMHSCETMGAASVICTDKTGTLTQNQMQVAETLLFEHDDAFVAEMVAANSTANLDFSDKHAPKAIGNPTEGALLLWLLGRDVDYRELREKMKVTNRLPFSTENKYMATVAFSPSRGCPVLFVKGAPEIILSMCDLSPAERTACEHALTSGQGRGMRTLALAWADTPSPDVFDGGRLHVEHLHLAGVFSISDPVRPTVPKAIHSCLDAGIDVKIVTGDTSGTAKEIGRQTGLWTEADNDSNLMTGTQFSAMSDAELKNRLSSLKILSRARPKDKERLVRLLRKQGQVVAVTGDGTNDAPALNAADVGLSMGDGTAVAKEASDMTILDNSFSTIANAVMWGRSLYKNIQRFIMYQMTINVAACLIVLVGAFTGTESPLTVTQMLWVNLIMDTFAAIALASLPPSPAVMAEKPRNVTSSIITPGMAYNIFGMGGLFTLLLLLLLFAMQHADITSTWDLFHFQYKHHNGLNDYEKSMFFTIFVMLQYWNIFNAKAFMSGQSAFSHLKTCRGFLLIVLVIIVGQIIIVEIGGKMFNVTHLALRDWLVIILGTSPVLWVVEAARMLSKK
ncbi:MAG: calcium-translocating P-type ATPase, PMCA-type [Prevotella sp.]|nr:calcium-translocating P-type ATPase, PMCA-type [Prevotella sp.]